MMLQLLTIVYAKQVHIPMLYNCNLNDYMRNNAISFSKHVSLRENGIGKNRIQIYGLFGEISSKLMLVSFWYSHIGAPLSCSKTFQGLF